jgi:Periplasmic component of the Tol biopolymer transport system
MSSRGHVVYRSGRANDEFRVLSWMDLSGKTAPLLAKPDYYFNPVLSPDGRRVALTLQADVYLHDLELRSSRRLTFTGGSTPAWTPDGEFVFWAREGSLSWVRANGGDTPKSQVLAKQPDDNLRVWSFAPDGKRLAYSEIDPETGSDLWTVPVVRDGSELRLGLPEVYLKTQWHENAATFSPDGRWMAYHSNQAGIDEVYVRAFPDKGVRWQISFGGGLYPKWSPTTKELFFRTLDSRMMVVPYELTRDSLAPGKQRFVSAITLAETFLSPNFDVTRDGRRLLVLLPSGDAKPDTSVKPVNFLLNFYDEVKRRSKQ